MTYLFVIWFGEKPIEKVFTSLRLVLWANVLNKLLNQTKNVFLLMSDRDLNRTFHDLIEKLEVLTDEEQSSLEISSSDHQNTMEKLLQNSKFISYDHDQRMMMNIEHIEDDDYLLKSSKETSIRIPDDLRLFDKLHTFGKALDKSEGLSKAASLSSPDEIHVIHVCDFQSQYQCESFILLSKIIYPQHNHLRQSFLTLAPAVIADDRPSMKYDEFAVNTYMKDVLAKMVNERTAASPFIPMAVFKLQLMCRKPNSIVHLRSNVETNHDALFLLYTGARLSSILRNYEDRYQSGSYPTREFFHHKLEEMLTSQDERNFLIWINSFESRFLTISLAKTNRIQVDLDKIFQEFILFSRRLSPYYSRVRILTENQSHLIPTMFARLELIERIVTLLRRTLSLLAIPFIDRM